MFKTYGKEIYGTVIPILGNNKRKYLRNYTDKCANDRKYKIVVKHPVDSNTIDLIEATLLALGIPVIKVENFSAMSGRGPYNKFIISTSL
jgi:hypothetical protein